MWIKKKMAHLIRMNRDHNWNISSHIAAECCNLHHIGARSGGIYTATRKKEIEKLQQIIFLELCERGYDVCSIVVGSGAREKNFLVICNFSRDSSQLEYYRISARKLHSLPSSCRRLFKAQADIDEISWRLCHWVASFVFKSSVNRQTTVIFAKIEMRLILAAGWR